MRDTTNALQRKAYIYDRYDRNVVPLYALSVGRIYVGAWCVNVG